MKLKVALCFVILFICRISLGKPELSTNWNYLSLDPNEMVGVVHQKKHADGVISFDLLNGYPGGKNIGLSQNASMIVRGFLYKCGAESAVILSIVIRDNDGKIIKMENFDQGKSLLVLSDSSVALATNALCQKDMGVSQFLAPSKDVTNQIVLICSIDGIPGEASIAFSESAQQANGLPAIISSSRIQFSSQSLGGPLVTTIDRYTGRMDIANPKSSVNLMGTCKRSELKQF